MRAFSICLGRLLARDAALFVIACVASLLVAFPAHAAEELEPLGIALEGYPYPYPVKFLPLEIEGQPVRMAFMDAPPTGPANGRVALLLHGKNFYGNAWA
ncbi:MAG: hypothetical protein JO117_02335, partial [Verrucomicrobia bacterium]|nr:hypothetical protein [Verrucomicrobiota bacterium]